MAIAGAWLGSPKGHKTVLCRQRYPRVIRRGKDELPVIFLATGNNEYLQVSENHGGNTQDRPTTGGMFRGEGGDCSVNALQCRAFGEESEKGVITMRRYTSVFLALCVAAWVWGLDVARAQLYIYPTLPGTTIRDYNAPGFRVEGNMVYPTIPGTNLRDYNAPGYRIEGKMIYPTMPGTTLRDYNARGYRIEGNMVYPTIPGTTLRDYMAPGFRVEDDMIYPTFPGTDLRDYSKPGFWLSR